MGEPLMQETVSSRRRVGKVVLLLSVLGLAGAALYALGNDEQSVDPATSMAVLPQPAQMTRGFMQPAMRPQMQPPQAMKNPIQGFMEISEQTPRGEVDIVAPITRKDMLQMAAGTAFAGLAALPNMALADDAKLKPKICAGNPTAIICRDNYGKPSDKAKGK